MNTQKQLKKEGKNKMDLKCTNCLEPWDIDYVLHEAPLDFKRNHGDITACPACKGKAVTLSDKEQFQSEAISALADILGDDIDGLASSIEDFNL